MSTRFRIALLVGMMVNAVIFGAGLLTVLMVPELATHAFYSVPAVVVISFALSSPIAWFIAPRLRLRYWREREQRERSSLAHSH